MSVKGNSPAPRPVGGLAQLSIAALAGAVTVAVWYVAIWKVIPVIAAASGAGGLELPFTIRIGVAFAMWLGRYSPLLTLVAGGGLVLFACIPWLRTATVRWGPIATLAVSLCSLAVTAWLLLVLLVYVASAVIPVNARGH